jgi:hypothetical protein
MTRVLCVLQHRDGLTGLSKADDRHAAVLGHLLVVANKVRLRPESCLRCHPPDYISAASHPPAVVETLCGAKLLAGGTAEGLQRRLQGHHQRRSQWL